MACGKIVDDVVLSVATWLGEGVFRTKVSMEVGRLDGPEEEELVTTSSASVTSILPVCTCGVVIVYTDDEDYDDDEDEYDNVVLLIVANTLEISFLSL